MKNFKGELGLILVALIWGSGFIGVSICLSAGLTPLQIVTYRFLIGTILLGIIFFKQIKENINKESIKAGCLIGLFLFIGFAFQTIGIKYTTASKNAFLTAINVVLVPFIGFLLYRRKVDKYSVISSIIAMIGIGILSLEADFSMNIGDILTIVCAFGFAFHIFFTGEYIKNCNPMVITFIEFLVATVLSFLLQIVFKEIKVDANKTAIIGVLYISVFCTTVAFLLQTICQKYVNGNKVAVILSTESVFGSILSVIILNEVLTFRLVLGCIVIFIGIIISETKLSFLRQKEIEESTIS